MRNLEGIRVAVWSPQRGELAAVQEKLERQGCRVASATTTAEVEGMLTREGVDLIVAHLSRGFREPLKLLEERVRALPPVLVVTGNEVGLYLEAMRAGAFDGLGLPLDEHELMRITERALDELHATVTT